MARGGGTAQALRLLNVHQASLIHHSDVLARGRVRQSAKHEWKKNWFTTQQPGLSSARGTFAPRSRPPSLRNRS